MVLSINSISLFNCYHFDFSNTRPITIKVIDNETNIPLQGITVCYELHEKKLAWNLNNILPLGGGIHDFYYNKSIKVTNSDGIVIFENMNKLGKTYEWLEDIYININGYNGFFNIMKSNNSNKQYFGYYIYNCPYCCNSDFYPSPSNDIDISLLTDSFSKNHEYITIKLRKYSSHNRIGKIYIQK